MIQWHTLEVQCLNSQRDLRRIGSVYGEMRNNAFQLPPPICLVRKFGDLGGDGSTPDNKPYENLFTDLANKIDVGGYQIALSPFPWCVAEDMDEAPWTGRRKCGLPWGLIECLRRCHFLDGRVFVIIAGRVHIDVVAQVGDER